MQCDEALCFGGTYILDETTFRYIFVQEGNSSYPVVIPLASRRDHILV